VKEMNKPQKIVIGITLILMGIITFVFLALQFEEMDPEGPYILCLLAIVLVGGGFFILFIKKKR